MKDSYTNRRAEPDFAKVKIEGPLNLVTTIVKFLEKHFISFRTSQFCENSQDSGIHIYLAIQRHQSNKTDAEVERGFL